jgi:hypothetical protein
MFRPSALVAWVKRREFMPFTLPKAGLNVIEPADRVDVIMDGQDHGFPPSVRLTLSIVFGREHNIPDCQQRP